MTSIVIICFALGIFLAWVSESEWRCTLAAWSIMAMFAIALVSVLIWKW